MKRSAAEVKAAGRALFGDESEAFDVNLAYLVYQCLDNPGCGDDSLAMARRIATAVRYFERAKELP